ncbi:glycoside hydrolase family 26 protein [Arcticibacter eurypsychrophilus]|uniref:glycoside hydrolase family 26 protein n=1 Tax=Arcticibacter eurypsychrophilus TaxID=1434752 RepID=UPI00084DCA6A|nr:glycosyl hydrolase [Arcticibacter eurypsychrophilus]
MKSSVLFFLSFLLCYVNSEAQQAKPTDLKATKETVSLYANLKNVMKKGYLVGHQDALAYGVNWKYEPGRSDIKDVTGDYPALYGWELGGIELGAKMNLDSVPFDKMRHYIEDGYRRGGVITISWHGTNPYTGKTAWDPTPGSVAAILPGAEKHDVYQAQLDKIADFLLSLKGSKGELIPVLFRPLHELTGGWFWWGAKSSSVDEFKTLFQYTVKYLRDVKEVHNLLYVYNTGGEFNNAEQFLERYPGDDLIDVVSFDTYQGGKAEIDTAFINDLDRHLTIIEAVAKEKNKIPAVAEMGFSKIPYSKWFTEAVAKAFTGHHFAYTLFWRNAGYKPGDQTTEYYVPFKGHASAPDFISYYNLPQTIFQKEASKLNLYK